MKNYIIALLSVTIAAFTVSGSDLFAQYEPYDAVYEKLVKEYTLHPDGSMAIRYQKQQKLQTYRAFHNLYGETFIVYDTARQELKFNEVHTVMADGKKVVTPPNAFNKVLPSFAANAPAYNGLREMVVTHTGLERGAVVHLDYTLLTRAGVLPFLSGSEILAQQEPVRHLEIRVRIPSGIDLRYRTTGQDIKPVESTEGIYRVYTWMLNEVPAISGEEGQRGGQLQYPWLFFTTSPDGNESLSFLSSQKEFSAALPEGIKESVRRIREEKIDPAAVAVRLQELVTEEMRYYSIPLSAALYRFRSPEQTWKSNGGTQIEKAILLAAMMRQAGMEAHVAGLAKTLQYDRKMAILGQPDEFCVRLNLKEKGVWYLSVTNQNATDLKQTLPGRTFMIFGENGKISYDETGEPRHVVQVTGNFIVSSDPKLTGEVTIYLEGALYPRPGLVRDTTMLRKALTGNLVKSDESALKKSVFNNENGFQTYTVQSDKPFRTDTGFYYFRLPVINSGVESWGYRNFSARRETDYEVPSAADESYQFTVTLPSGMALFTPERKINLSNKAGRYTLEVRQEKGKVTVTRSLKLNGTYFPVSVYPELKILMDQWNNPWNRQLVFRRKAI